MIELTTLSIYLIILLWIGLRSSRKIHSSTDYTLAGRDISWMIILATTSATMIGGGASVGTISRVYEIGIGAVVVTCAWHLQLIFSGIWVAPRLRSLNLITVADYLELRFGPLAHGLAVVNCLFFLVGALVAQMVAMATIASSIMDIPYGSALLIGATVTIFYSTVGGIRAVVATDVLQFLILVIGIGIASALLLIKNDGFFEMSQQIGLEHFNITGHWSATHFISLFVAFFLGEMFIPPYTVRFLIARDPRQAKLGISGSGIFLLLFLPITTFIIGLSAIVDPAVQLAAQGGVQQVFPALVRATFHPVFAGIMIAAMMAAAMSSADSVLSCHATVIMEDIYRKYFNPQGKDRLLLRVAQWTTLITGIAAAIFAYYFRDIIQVLEFVYDYWAPGMVLPFLVGLFWYHPKRIYAVVISMCAGSASTTIWLWLGSPWDVGAALLGFSIAVTGFFVALPFTSKRRLGNLFQPRKSSG